ncbi:hypothetical protein [Bacillus paralicheniformis]|uniref:hypothetical protein n=1 Tax=Bacillus paralicheniformis TaxID=1648923 RepID=UPI001177A26F|nr:hypothetical protein [Bacillus paralicheniformis]MCU4668640.1 hypothetical protein [Bacillus paralicheniformis]
MNEYLALQKAIGNHIEQMKKLQINRVQKLYDLVNETNNLQQNIYKNIPTTVFSLTSQLDSIYKQLNTASLHQSVTKQLLSSYKPYASFQNLIDSINDFSNLDVSKINFSVADELIIDDPSELENKKYIEEADEFIQEQHLEEGNVTAEDINNTIENADKTLNPYTKLYVFQTILFFVLMAIYIQIGGEEALGINFQEFVETYMGFNAIRTVTKSSENNNRE